MKRNLILLLTLCHSTLLIYSQNTTNSPTSMFGLGELSTGEGGQYSGLGGVIRQPMLRLFRLPTSE